MLEQAQVHTWLKLCLLAIDHRRLLDALISVSVCFRGWVGWCVLVPLFTLIGFACQWFSVVVTCVYKCVFKLCVCVATRVCMDVFMYVSMDLCR